MSQIMCAMILLLVFQTDTHYSLLLLLLTLADSPSNTEYTPLLQEETPGIYMFPFDTL